MLWCFPDLVWQLLLLRFAFLDFVCFECVVNVRPVVCGFVCLCFAVRFAVLGLAGYSTPGLF